MLSIAPAPGVLSGIMAMAREFLFDGYRLTYEQALMRHFGLLRAPGFPIWSDN